MDVSVIIINYNTRALTLACLSSIFRYTSGLKWEVIVVDNASTECDPDVFKEYYPDICLVRNEINAGFARGNNLGLRLATGKYILLLNSDIELKDNALLKAFQFMEAHTRAGVCTIRLIFPDGRHQSVAQRFPSVRYKLAELLRFQKLLGRKRGGRLLLGAFFDFQSTIRADWVWGAFFMFRRRMLEPLPGGQLNDEYFMYGEDMQWCYDFRKKGWKVWYLASTEAIHYMGGSSGNKHLLMKMSSSLFMQKNYCHTRQIIISFLDAFLQR
jgi:GT2 family glycosyltransferase